MGDLKIYDGHIHTRGVKCDPPEAFLEKTAKCGVVGGTVFSVHPARYRPFPGFDQRAKSRIDWILEYTSHTPGFLPFFFADLSEPDILDQIDYARKGGIRGFKVICDGAYCAGDYLEAVQAMADTGLPVMFHAGIDNVPHMSSENNRPIRFERLLNVKGLRFSLAHFAWPWCDEFVGTFAKFECAREMDPDGGHPMMYVDTTPGTPGIYRRDAFRKLFLSGMRARERTFFGSDLLLNDYNPGWTEYILGRDSEILEEIRRDAEKGEIYPSDWLPPMDHLVEHLFHDTWLDFCGA